MVWLNVEKQQKPQQNTQNNSYHHVFSSVFLPYIPSIGRRN